MKTMARKPALIAALLFSLAPAMAAADELDDVTMQVIDAEELAGTEAITSRIELPEQARERAREASADGLETANQARERHRERRREMQAENATALREQREQMFEYRERAREESDQLRREMREQMQEGGRQGRP